MTQTKTPKGSLLGNLTIQILIAMLLGATLGIFIHTNYELDFAKELQNRLESAGRKTEKTEIRNEEHIETVPEKLILKLSPTDLLKIGISQNHLRTALIVIAFGAQIFQQTQDIFKEKAEEYSNEVVNFMSGSGWALITFMLIFFLFVSILISLFRTLLKYFDFKLLKKEDSYRIESGLINKRNVMVPLNKVQELKWETGR